MWFFENFLKILKYQISWKFVQWRQSCSMRMDRQTWVLFTILWIHRKSGKVVKNIVIRYVTSCNLVEIINISEEITAPVWKQNGKLHEEDGVLIVISGKDMDLQTRKWEAVRKIGVWEGRWVIKVLSRKHTGGGCHIQEDGVPNRHYHETSNLIQYSETSACRWLVYRTPYSQDLMSYLVKYQVPLAVKLLLEEYGLL
jgi:hypothetical protein